MQQVSEQHYPAGALVDLHIDPDYVDSTGKVIMSLPVGAIPMSVSWHPGMAQMSCVVCCGSEVIADDEGEVAIIDHTLLVVSGFDKGMLALKAGHRHLGSMLVPCGEPLPRDWHVFYGGPLPAGNVLPC